MKFLLDGAQLLVDCFERRSNATYYVGSMTLAY
jgi:hypothetical protein